MASVYKREGAGRANRWYARIKVGTDWKVIRLPAVHSGPKALKKDKALHLAVESELLANKALGMDVEETVAHEFARKVISLGKENDAALSESTETYLNRWVKESEAKVAANKLAEGSYKGRKGIVKIYLDYIGNEGKRPLGSMFTYSKMKEFLSHWEKAGKAKKTVEMYATVLSSVARDAMKEGKLFKNPLSDQEIGGKVAVQRSGFTQAEADSILSCDDDFVRTGFAIMLCTGMRSGDALALKWENIDLKEKVLKFTPQKQRAGDKRELVVPICEKLVRILSKEDSREGHVIENMDIRTLGRRFFRLTSKLKVNADTSPHSARHFFISLLANAGITEEIRMKLVGHSKGKNRVHSAYTHIEVETMRKELEKVEWLK